VDGSYTRRHHSSPRDAARDALRAQPAEPQTDRRQSTGHNRRRAGVGLIRPVRCSHGLSHFADWRDARPISGDHPAVLAARAPVAAPESALIWRPAHQCHSAPFWYVRWSSEPETSRCRPDTASARLRRPGRDACPLEPARNVGPCQRRPGRSRWCRVADSDDGVFGKVVVHVVRR